MHTAAKARWRKKHERGAREAGGELSRYLA